MRYGYLLSILSLLAGTMMASPVLETKPPVFFSGDDSESARILESMEVLKEIFRIPERSIPEKLLMRAHAVVIIPGMVKAAYIIGGRRGKGIAMIRLPSGEWSNPVFLKMTGGSLGWQIGIQKADILLVFTSSKGIEDILQGRLTLGAGASVAAGPIGRDTTASTDIDLEAEIFSYSRSKGFFAGLSMEGAVMEYDRDSTELFYRSRVDTPEELFHRDPSLVPSIVTDLKALLRRYFRI